MSLEDMAVELGRHGERINSLEEHRERQNGCLQRIEAKLDRFTWWLVLTLGGAVTSLVVVLLKQ